jgi:hypothetical protein
VKWRKYARKNLTVYALYSIKLRCRKADKGDGHVAGMVRNNRCIYGGNSVTKAILGYNKSENIAPSLFITVS